MILRVFRLLVALLLPMSLGAQAVTVTHDSAAADPAGKYVPLRLWASLGFDPGLVPVNTVGGFLSVWGSVNHLALGARVAGVGLFYGEERIDKAVLIGARTSTSGSFLLFGVGPAAIASNNSCGCRPSDFRPTKGGIAYTAEGHGTLWLVGLGASLFGAIGGDTYHNYSGLAVSLDVGWFGR